MFSRIRHLKMERITEFSKAVGVPVELLLGRNRDARTADARHLYWKLLRTKKNLSYAEIGRLNDRTDATVLLGINRINSLIEADDKRACEMWNKVKDIEV